MLQDLQKVCKMVRDASIVRQEYLWDKSDMDVIVNLGKNLCINWWKVNTKRLVEGNLNFSIHSTSNK